MNERLEKQMNFLLEIDKLKNIVRQNYLSDGSRRENDTEHSWHLAAMTTILAEYFPKTDILRTMKMVLLHDIVEIDAGDTFAYDPEGYETKSEREEEAAERIFALLPEEQEEEFKSLWYEFEEMETPEAICGAIFDRIQPLMMNFYSKGKMWKDKGVTEKKLRKRNEIVFQKGPPALQEYVEHMIKEAKRLNYLPS